MAKARNASDSPGGGIERRKLEHVEIVLNKQVEAREKTTGFELMEFEHCALPEIDFDAIDLSTEFLGHKLQAPLMVTGMTGGYGAAEEINCDIAAAADKEGIAFGVGSMRAIFEQPQLAGTYKVRKVAKNVFLAGNIGGFQLKHFTTDRINRVLSDVGCDALCVHLNPMHEAVQKEGDLDWTGVLDAIRALCRDSKVPIIAKEVGSGISGTLARQLQSVGVKAIDVSGAGGTSWSGGVESYRGGRPQAQLFWDWGIPTAIAVRDVSTAVRVPVIASGGVRNGLESAKAIRLGATLAGAASPFLKAQAKGGEKAVRETISRWKRELRMACFGTGSKDLAALRKARLYKSI
jgi:isopentenyl-diphosphate delta-isomerase